jgi:hypothetical protein
MGEHKGRTRRVAAATVPDFAGGEQRLELSTELIEFADRQFEPLANTDIADVMQRRKTMDLDAIARLPDASAKHSNCVINGLLEGVEITLLLEGRSKSWAIERPSEHAQGLFVIDVLKLLDKVS